MQTLHLIISGKVQGVFYRAQAKETAESLGLKGWVKNTGDGNVEAMVEGDEKSTAAFIEWCKQGPDRAVVSGVEVKEVENNNFDSFQILR